MMQRAAAIVRPPTPSGPCTYGARTPSSRAMPEPVSSVPFRIEPLEGEVDLDGVLHVESESFTNPWTREMYAWELQNRNVCHIYVVRTADRPVAAFCAFWLVFDEIHINNVAVLPDCRGQGIGTRLMEHVL